MNTPSFNNSRTDAPKTTPWAWVLVLVVFGVACVQLIHYRRERSTASLVGEADSEKSLSANTHQSKNDTHSSTALHKDDPEWLLALKQFMDASAWEDATSADVANFNAIIRRSRSTKEATGQYWDVVEALNNWRRYAVRVLPLNEDGLVENTDLENAYRGALPGMQSQIKTACLIHFAGLIDKHEASAARLLDTSKADARATRWAKDYAEWLTKQADFKGRLGRALAADVRAQQALPTPIVASLNKYGTGKISFSTAWEQQQTLRSQLSSALRTCETTGRDLDTEAAILSAECLKLCTALAKDYGKEFQPVALCR